MNLQLEIYRARKSQQSIQIACVGLDGSDLKEFNQKHNRGLDGRFGSKFRSQEIAESMEFNRKLSKDIFDDLRQVKDYFAKGQYKDFQKAIEASDKTSLQAAFKKLGRNLALPTVDSLVSAITLIESAPFTLGHVLVGKEFEAAVVKAGENVVKAVEDAIEPLKKPANDLFIAAEEIFDRVITRQEKSDPDLSGKSKAVKLKAFNSAVT